ncbi:MAG: MarR family transcriptional regulator [Crenarchaeota archaeon]|nr:MarR family transcriptional regulator [Thermoproteota archaeon]
MYRFFAMSFTHIQGRIIDEVARHPTGTSFNRLADRLKGKLSRVVLSREVRNLSRKGVLKIARDPNHRQRKIIMVESVIINVLEKMREDRLGRRLSRRKAARITLKYISTYRRLVEEEASQLIKDYVKYKVLQRFEKILEEVV